MAEFAQFHALENTDTTFRLPNNIDGNKKTFNFNLPNLDPATAVILMFKVATSGAAQLQMIINEKPPPFAIDFTLDPPPGLHQPRSWHEIIGPGGGLKASNNVLEVLNNTNAGSVVTVSDIVFLYHAKTV
jgi:hypothetical protein